MNRRSFLVSALSTATLPLAARALPPHAVPVLDAHVHLFDPTRPGGIPWPEPGDPIYKPALPGRLQSLAAPLGVVGAIAIEASPNPADNQWLLSLVEQHPFIVGMVGNLPPGQPDFQAGLDRLRPNPLFLGIRYGNLWNHDLAADYLRPGFLHDLQTLAKAGLVFESANPTPALLTALLAIAQHVPDLRIMIDHLPHLSLPVNAAERASCLQTLHELASSRTVSIKFSEILTPTPASLQTSSQPYLEQLDRLWHLFGPDRVLFGSDWPNSDHVASYPEILTVARDFIARRSPAAAGAVFSANAHRFYRWQGRTPEQHIRIADTR